VYQQGIVGAIRRRRSVVPRCRWRTRLKLRRSRTRRPVWDWIWVSHGADSAVTFVVVFALIVVVLGVVSRTTN
jgi:hypothetical protein